MHLTTQLLIYAICWRNSLGHLPDSYEETVLRHEMQFNLPPHLSYVFHETKGSLGDCHIGHREW